MEFLFLRHKNSLSTVQSLKPHKDHYEVKWFGHPPHHNLPKFVTFSTLDVENLPVPAPELLALHATFCKVAHFSGATKHIDEVSCTTEEIDDLLTDASANVLGYMLCSQRN